jgi:hypothetical protein
MGRGRARGAVRLGAPARTRARIFAPLRCAMRALRQRASAHRGRPARADAGDVARLTKHAAGRRRGLRCVPTRVAQVCDALARGARPRVQRSARASPGGASAGAHVPVRSRAAGPTRPRRRCPSGRVASESRPRVSPARSVSPFVARAASGRDPRRGPCAEGSMPEAQRPGRGGRRTSSRGRQGRRFMSCARQPRVAARPHAGTRRRPSPL